jgi:hypothetical protein
MSRAAPPGREAAGLGTNPDAQPVIASASIRSAGMNRASRSVKPAPRSGQNKRQWEPPRDEHNSNRTLGPLR